MRFAVLNYFPRLNALPVQILLLLALINSAAAQPSQNSVPIPAPLPPGLQTVEFFSPAVNRTMKYDIVLPADYEAQTQRYPVLYLLHGYMQNYTVWGRNLAAAFYAAELGDLIIVMPDGGNSWFVNYAENADGQLNNWEDHIIKDVIPHVDASFRTLAQREGRAIAGLSMGGYGAFMLGLRHPAMFISIASTSGALSYARDRSVAIEQGQIRVPARSRSPQQQEEIARADAFISSIIAIPGFSTQDERTPAGTDFLTVEQAQAYDPFQIIYTVPKSRLPHIYLDSGTEDNLVNVAREFMQVLLVNNVPFEYMQSQGRHNSEYWRRSVGHFMNIQYEVMQRALGNRP
jgi:putative tributyrin esterase